jgi:hypothetical protein
MLIYSSIVGGSVAVTMGSIIIARFPVTPMLVGFPLKFGLACTGENSPYDIKGHAQDQFTYTAVAI